MIALKQGLKLRKVGKSFLVVRACDENVDMTDVYSLNESAALIWRRLESGAASIEDLAAVLCETYGIDRASALKDAGTQVAEWEKEELVEES